MKHMFVFISIEGCDPMSASLKFEPISVKSTLNRVKAISMPFTWSINPYRGCQHGCSFCYARSTHSFLGLDTDESFQKDIKIKQNAPEILEKQILNLLKKQKHKPMGRVAIGTATDPYQPIEAKTLLTRQILEVLVRYQIPTTLTTRSPLVLRDIDLFQKLPDFSVNVSLSTMDTSIIKSLEPATSYPIQRMNMVKELKQAGITSGIFLAPILPYLGDQEEALAELIQAAAEHQARYVMPSFLRLSTPDVKQWFFQVLHEKYPKLISIYGSLYHQSASLPKWYKEAKMKKISELLKKYHIPEKEMSNFTTPTAKLVPFPDPAAVDDPIQLSFSF
jgi:DNA repair photolyase